MELALALFELFLIGFNELPDTLRLLIVDVTPIEALFEAGEDVLRYRYFIDDASIGFEPQDN